MDSKKFNDWWSTVVKMHGYASNPDDPCLLYTSDAADE